MLLNKSVAEDTMKYYFSRMSRKLVHSTNVLLQVEFRKTDRLEVHHMSEWDENDQFEVCWVVQYRNGTYCRCAWEYQQWGK